MRSFITFEEESSVIKVFQAGPMHEISGKKVEVKNATPKGSGPQGRGITPGGRGALLPGGRGFLPGRAYPEFPPGYGMGPGYHIPPGDAAVAVPQSVLIYFVVTLHRSCLTEAGQASSSCYA